MKYRFMAAHRGEHRVEKMAENLGVTRSGFYAWRRRGRAARQAADEQLRELIEGIQEEVHYRYGSPRMTRELRRRGHRVGHNRVARLMRQGKLGARRRKAYRLPRNLPRIRDDLHIARVALRSRNSNRRSHTGASQQQRMRHIVSISLPGWPSTIRGPA